MLFNKYHHYRRLDIRLIKEFAKSKNEKLKFIKSSWKTSSDDLKKNKFDVFVGGMSINPKRQKEFLFSAHLVAFNKATMTQCKSLSKYKSFNDIDSPETLVIENRGGTNESIALAKLKNAKLLIINDNKQAIKFLTDGFDGIQPNIMFTDTVEIAYQHSINSNLCQIPIQVDNTKSYKTFMFNKDKNGKKLRDNFDTWYKNKPSSSAL
ncbi:MAG: cyclohexadienyl dehydratase [Francisella sp.]|jgi:cyclohexadienyl dehydratase